MGNLPEFVFDHAFGRDLAWRGMDIRVMGGVSWFSAERAPFFKGAVGGMAAADSQIPAAELVLSPGRFVFSRHVFRVAYFSRAKFQADWANVGRSVSWLGGSFSLSGLPGAE